MTIKEIQKGQLLHVSNYEFQDGGEPMDKFCIILSLNGEDAYLIHCLTTTKNKKKLPVLNFGCSVVKSIPYFFIPSKQDLQGNLGFTFKEDTLIFFQNNIRKESIHCFDNYCKKGQLSIKENLPNSFLKRLIKCLLKSEFVPMNLINDLQLVKESL